MSFVGQDAVKLQDEHGGVRVENRCLAVHMGIELPIELVFIRRAVQAKTIVNDDRIATQSHVGRKCDAQALMQNKELFPGKNGILGRQLQVLPRLFAHGFQARRVAINYEAMSQIDIRRPFGHEQWIGPVMNESAASRAECAPADFKQAGCTSARIGLNVDDVEPFECERSIGL